MITTILRYLNLQYPMMIQGDKPTHRQNKGRCQQNDLDQWFIMRF